MWSASLMIVSKGSLQDVHEINAHRAVRSSMSLCPTACLNLGISGRILFNFGMDVVPLEVTQNFYFSVSYNR